MAGRGGHRLGAGRRRRQPAASKPASPELLRFAEAIFQGIALSALPIAPEASDEELVQIGLSDLVLTEIRRGRGGEILRLAGNIVSMLAASQDGGKEEESVLMTAMANLPGADAAPNPAAPDAVQVVGSGRSVRELASVLNTEKAQSLAPRQSELFDAALPGDGTVLN